MAAAASDRLDVCGPLSARVVRLHLLILDASTIGVLVFSMDTRNAPWEGHAN
jgi:hypothetical protein